MMIDEGEIPDDDEVCDHRCCDCHLDDIIFPGDTLETAKMIDQIRTRLIHEGMIHEQS